MSISTLLLFVTLILSGNMFNFSPLSLFSSVAYPNDECAVREDNGDLINGTCYSASDCTKSGGEARGECYNGYGVCCIFQYTCGNSSNANISYFVNPNYPQSFNEPSSCTLKVNKIHPQMCQIRLDFQLFDISGPTEYGPHVNLKQTGSSFGSINSESNCKDDLFVVTQSNRNQPIPIICGQNEGHHMYIPVDESDSNVISLTFLTGINEFNRRWKIKISQLPCSSSSQHLAPQGCLQYYTSPRGIFKTFNYEGRKYLQNIDYSVCIRKPKNMCYLTLSGTNLFTATSTTSTTTPSTTAASASTFTSRPEPVFHNITSNVLTLRGRSQTPFRVAEEYCTDNGYWVTWPGSNRICSRHLERLLTPITISTNSHQVIHFHSLTWTQAMAINNQQSHGFAFSYAHAPCTHGFL